MNIGYADPPYIGCAHLYKDHPDYAGEVDHVALIDRLESDYDGWVLHAEAWRTWRGKFTLPADYQEEFAA